MAKCLELLAPPKKITLRRGESLESAQRRVLKQRENSRRHYLKQKELKGSGKNFREYKKQEREARREALEQAIKAGLRVWDLGTGLMTYYPKNFFSKEELNQRILSTKDQPYEY